MRYKKGVSERAMTQRPVVGIVPHWALAMPKVELHAHLNGSLTPRDLKQLKLLVADPKSSTWTEEGGDVDEQAEEVNRISKGPPPGLAACFATFAQIHKLTDSLQAIRYAARMVTRRFALENCVYLELRTTPRRVLIGHEQEVCDLNEQPSDKEGNSDSADNYVNRSSKLEYIVAVLCGVKDALEGLPEHTMVVRLLVSVNRALSLSEAEENVSLALECARRFDGPFGDTVRNDVGEVIGCEPIVVGVELSGDPTKGDARSFLPQLQRARESGLKISIHLAEVENNAETEALLRWHPERVGHAIHMSEANLQLLKDLGIPLEACLTSNIVTESVVEYTEHHARELIQAEHPLSLNTDDAGIFGTSLSREYALASEHFALSPLCLRQIANDSLEHAFCTANTAAYIQKTIMSSKTTESSPL